MDARVGLRSTTVAALLFIVLSGLASTTSAAPIKLSNDVSVVWADVGFCLEPEFAGSNVCLKPISVVGAPRFVPDARNVADMVEIRVEFLNVFFGGQEPSETPLRLNVGDAALNEVLVPGPKPGPKIPLELTHAFRDSGDVTLNLRQDFLGFESLPSGDLFFTVDFRPDLTRCCAFSPDQDYAVKLTFSGPGIEVPEPATLVLLLGSLTSVGLGAGWRRIRKRASHRIG